ncbi:hypothetical protein Gpo141_00004176 [Globisporangium polare]
MMFLFEHYPELECPSLAAEQALRGEHVEMVMWLQTHFPDQVGVPQLRGISEDSLYWRLVTEFMEPTPDEEEATGEEPTVVEEATEEEPTPDEELTAVEALPEHDATTVHELPEEELLGEEPTLVEELSKEAHSQ